jgi:Zn-dependent peptidase ImmA (M78 family)/transcriptional regulator with XRE-family HTH domain
MTVETINPQMVILARQSRGITQTDLSRLLGWNQGLVSKIENGLEPLSDERLEALATALDYPVHFFARQSVIDGPGLTEVYHRKRAKASATALHKMHAEAVIRRYEIADLLKSFDGLPEDPFPSFPIDDFEGNPAKIARTMRAVLQIPPGPIFNMTKVIEAAGGVVLSCSFDTRDVDGFSRWRADTPPIFYLNVSQPPDRWRWTLAHEAGHVAMHTTSSPYDDMEKDANLFAEEFLAPKNEIKYQLANLTLSRLAALKQYWKISMQALINRAFHLGILSENSRRYFFMQLGKAGYLRHEPDEIAPPTEPPELLSKIVKYHRERLGYSDDDLCRLLALNKADLYKWYKPEGRHLHPVSP